MPVSAFSPACVCLGKRRSHSETFSSKQVIQWLRHKKVKGCERGCTKRRGSASESGKMSVLGGGCGGCTLTEGQCKEGWERQEMNRGGEWAPSASGLPHDAV